MSPLKKLTGFVHYIRCFLFVRTDITGVSCVLLLPSDEKL